MSSSRQLPHWDRYPVVSWRPLRPSRNWSGPPPDDPNSLCQLYCRLIIRCRGFLGVPLFFHFVSNFCFGICLLRWCRSWNSSISSWHRCNSAYWPGSFWDCLARFCHYFEHRKPHIHLQFCDCCCREYTVIFHLAVYRLISMILWQWKRPPFLYLLHTSQLFGCCFRLRRLFRASFWGRLWVPSHASGTSWKYSWSFLEETLVRTRGTALQI